LWVRTTLDLDSGLLRAAKRRAAETGRTLTSILEEALRRYLQPSPARRGRYRYAPLTKRGRLVPGVDLADRDALYERMEGRK
jgi:hypothetical protein